MKLELLSGGSNAGEDSNIKRGVKKSEMGTDQEAPIRRPLKKMSWGGQKAGRRCCVLMRRTRQTFSLQNVNKCQYFC